MLRLVVVVLSCILFAQALVSPSPETGSGYGMRRTSVAPQVGSGDASDDTLDVDEEGSGVVLATTPSTLQCSGSYCFCVDDVNKEIPNTRLFLEKPNCMPVDEPLIMPQKAQTYEHHLTVPQTTTISTQPVDPANEGLAIDIDEGSQNNLPPVISDTPVPTTSANPTTASTTLLASTKATTTAVVSTKAATTVKTIPPAPAMSSKMHMHATHMPMLKPTTVYNVPEVPKGLDSSIESSEEETNEIGDAVSLKRAESHAAAEAMHPGWLAAIIGGGIVGLLITILLIMFIVYRMRKKDEGSYPLDDSKPRLSTYTKPSNREFYA